MKLSFLPILLFSVTAFSVTAQVKFNMSTGKLAISEVDWVTIQGRQGSEILIEVEGKVSTEEDERAAGLKEISATGLTDNTGIGLVTVQNGNTLEVGQLSRRNNNRYIFKVPAGVAVSYEHSTYHGKTIVIEDTQSEIEVSANYNDIEITNASGPLALNTVYGDITADFSNLSLTNDIKLYSTYKSVEVTVPSTIKADFRLKSSYGKMYTDLDLQMEKKSNGLKPLSSSNITGSTNGGGIDFSITSVYKNIYLRKG